MAGGIRQRQSLFEEWLIYGLGRGDGLVIFESEKKCYVEFAFGEDPGTTFAEVSTWTWKDIFGVPLPKSASEQLTLRGFHPPEAGDGNYWQKVEQSDAEVLAELTEWAFREIFGEEGKFIASAAYFELQAQ